MKIREFTTNLKKGEIRDRSELHISARDKQPNLWESLAHYRKGGGVETILIADGNFQKKTPLFYMKNKRDWKRALIPITIGDHILFGSYNTWVGSFRTTKVGSIQIFKVARITKVADEYVLDLRSIYTSGTIVVPDLGNPNAEYFISRAISLLTNPPRGREPLYSCPWDVFRIRNIFDLPSLLNEEDFSLAEDYWLDEFYEDVVKRTKDPSVHVFIGRYVLHSNKVELYLQLLHNSPKDFKEIVTNEELSLEEKKASLIRGLMYRITFETDSPHYLEDWFLSMKKDELYELQERIQALIKQGEEIKKRNQQMIETPVEEESVEENTTDDIANSSENKENTEMQSESYPNYLNIIRVFKA